MIMMKKTFYLCLGLFLLLGSAGEAGAQMVFHLDFWQDGSYEDTWTPQIGEEAVVGIYVSNVPPPGLITMECPASWADHHGLCPGIRFPEDPGTDRKRV
ncbi:MAG: hypothetical protein JRJ83_18645 [Deltaproteobacteria bacterium]|nr:hypothetical protein [Deltaproteobacteria bacterium]